MPPPLEILYEDRSLLVVNKPAGLHSVMQRGKTHPSIASQLVERFPEISAAALKAEDGGLIHRLDFETSGCLIAAKTSAAWSRLSAALRSGAVLKTYWIAVDGCVDQGRSIENYVGSPHRGARKMKVYIRRPARRARALPAASLFRPLQYNSALNLSLVEAEAHTARRHQIRCHSAFLGHPLAGDINYGSKRCLSDLAANTPHLPAFILHARTVEFEHPLLGRPISCSAPAPDYLRIFFPELPSA